MKHRNFCIWVTGISLLSFPLAPVCLQGAASEAASSAQDEKALKVQPPAPAETSAQEPLTSADTDAPLKAVFSDKTPPPSVRLSGPAAEVAKLANSGVADSIMLAYVTNSSRIFNLGAEEIIYLNDIGVPGSVVTAMIQRDQALKTSLALANAGPPGGLAEPVAPGPPPDNQQFPTSTAVPGTALEQAAEPGGEPFAGEAPLTPPEGADPMFNDALSPYGNWVDIDGYGRCWQPSVGIVSAGWQPYFDGGHWVYSDCGWYWLSDYSWGWAPFHYGSWFRHARLGWCWLPGKVWGPSWVCWRYNDGYCGWAPLPPGSGFTAGVGLTFRGHSVWDRDDKLGLRPDHYHFVSWSHFEDRQLRPHDLAQNERAQVYGSSTVANRIVGDGHTIINEGVPPSRVVAATRRPIHTVALREVTSPATGGARIERLEAGGRALAVYRPDPALVSRKSTGEGALGPAQSSHGQTPWTSRSGATRQSLTELRQDNPPPGSARPLILRGQQPSGLRESAPPDSLIVIGRRNSARPSASAPWAPGAASAKPAPGAPSAPEAKEAASVQRSVNRPSNSQYPQRDWMGVVSSSPQPSWFGNEARSPSRFNNDAFSRPESGGYQSIVRPSAQEVPRYAPAPSYTPPQRSYSAPASAASARAPSYEARPAPAAPPAASAPAASRSSTPSQSSSRNGR